MLRLPVVVHGPVRARLRHARFTQHAGRVTVVGERTHGRRLEAARARVPPAQARPRRLETGRSPLQFRTEGAAQPLGVALDWFQLEARGVEPDGDRGVLARLLLLLVGVPLAIGLLTRSADDRRRCSARASRSLGVGAVWVDRLGGLVALAAAVLCRPWW